MAFPFAVDLCHNLLGDFAVNRHVFRNRVDLRAFFVDMFFVFVMLIGHG